MMHALVSLAKATIEKYVTEKKKIKPEGVPEEFIQSRAGVFVSLKKHGELRGCIGTISPVAASVAEEVIRNAISASTQDPRFSPVEPSELAEITYSVDVLGPAERVRDIAELDPKRYGVIVSCGMRRGLLLPDLEGVDTVEHQLSIAMMKAGISPGEEITVERFEVIRYK